MNATTKLEQAGTPPLWLTYREAQRLSSLGRTTLSMLVNSGEIRAARIGRAVRIERKSLEDFMERCATIQPQLPNFNNA